MKPEDTEILTFKPEIEGDFIYIFNVVKTNDLSPKGPNIVISFNQDDKTFAKIKNDVHHLEADNRQEIYILIFLKMEKLD